MEVELIVTLIKHFHPERKAKEKRQVLNSDSKLSAVGEDIFSFKYFYCRRRERLEINVLQNSFYCGFRAKMSTSTQLSLCHVLSVQSVLCFWFLPSLLWCYTFCHTCVHFLFCFEDFLFLIFSYFALPSLMRDLYLIRLPWCRQSFLLAGP